MREPTGENALDLAMKRLERAIALLEQRRGAGPAAGGGLFDQDDRARLAEELDQAKVREKALEAAGAEASAALGRAIAEIKAALASAPSAADEAAAALAQENEEA
jgi:hypothetical protein